MSKSKATLIFLGVFLTSLLVQGHVWSTSDYVDNKLWVPAVAQLATSTLPTPDQPTYGYPATTLLLPGSMLVRQGIAPRPATTTTIVVLLSLFIALAALVAYLLRPQSPWWLAVAAIMVLSRVYPDATPPSALATASIPLICLLVLYAYQHRKESLPFIALGLVGGVSLATRIDITTLVLGFGLLFLCLRSFKKTVLSGVIALATFCAVDPYMYTHPIAHVLAIYAKIHSFSNSGPIGWPFKRLIKTFPLAFLTFVLGIVLLGAHKLVRPLRSYLIWVITITVVIFGILLSSFAHPDWYFFPLLMTWQILSPVLLFVLIEGDHSDKKLFGLLPTSAVPLLFTLCFIVGQFVVYLHPAYQVTN